MTEEIKTRAKLQKMTPKQYYKYADRERIIIPVGAHSKAEVVDTIVLELERRGSKPEEEKPTPEISAKPTRDELSNMTKSQLLRYAAKQDPEISIPPSSKKDYIIDTIIIEMNERADKPDAKVTTQESNRVVVADDESKARAFDQVVEKNMEVCRLAYEMNLQHTIHQEACKKYREAQKDMQKMITEFSTGMELLDYAEANKSEKPEQKKEDASEENEEIVHGRAL